MSCRNLSNPCISDHCILAPQIYLTTLERVKDVVQRQCGRRGWGAAETAALASSVGGGVASLATQSVIVPVDVVRPRL